MAVPTPQEKVVDLSVQVAAVAGSLMPRGTAFVVSVSAGKAAAVAARYSMCLIFSPGRKRIGFFRKRRKLARKSGAQPVGGGLRISEVFPKPTWLPGSAALIEGVRISALAVFLVEYAPTRATRSRPTMQKQCASQGRPSLRPTVAILSMQSPCLFSS